MKTLIYHRGKAEYISTDMAKMYHLTNGCIIHDPELFAAIKYNDQAWYIAGIISRGAVLKASIKPFSG